VTRREKRVQAEALAVKYGVSVRVVFEHIELFTRPIDECARMCLVKDTVHKPEVGNGN